MWLVVWEKIFEVFNLFKSIFSSCDLVIQQRTSLLYSKTCLYRHLLITISCIIQHFSSVPSFFLFNACYNDLPVITTVSYCRVSDNCTLNILPYPTHLIRTPHLQTINFGVRAITFENQLCYCCCQLDSLW